MEHHNSKALEELRGMQNIEILEFPAEVTAELKKLTSIMLDEEAAANPDFKRVYDSYQLFRENYSKWTDVSEDAYQRSMHPE
jgi:TRAP-type mannitol/chloroaromatic compound transport system substrate-binding protein